MHDYVMRSWDGSVIRNPTPRERFEAKIDRHPMIPGGCHLWMAYCMRDGQARFLGTEGVQVQASRFAYELYVSVIPHGLVVGHSCHVPQCVNTEHMYLATYREVSDRMPDSSRARMGARMRWVTHCASGHEFTGENTYTHALRPIGGRPPVIQRACRACNSKAAVAYKQRKAKARRESAGKTHEP